MEKMFHSVRFWTYGEGGENTSSMKPRCEDPNRASAQNFARQRPTGKALGVKIIRCPSLSMKPPPLPSLTIVWFYRERSDREYLKLHFDEKTRARRTAVRAPEVDAAGAGSPDGIAGLLVRPTGDQT